MSRAYRITVRESETRTLTGSDEISTRLELLDILPPEATAGLLKGALAERGFEEQPDGTFARQDGGLTVTVDPCDGTVTVKSEVSEAVGLEVRRDTSGYDDIGPSEKVIRERMKDQLKADIDKKAEQEAGKLQEKATAALEQHLDELQPELGRIVNKVTREALKQKARSLGTVTEVSEDAEAGNLTLTIEV
jgi:hypothetical protein